MRGAVDIKNLRCWNCHQNIQSKNIATGFIPFKGFWGDVEVMTIFLGGKSSIKMSMATAGFHSHICIRFDHNHVVHITVEDGDGTHFDGHTTGRWSSAWINSKFPKNKWLTEYFGHTHEWINDCTMAWFVVFRWAGIGWEQRPLHW